MKASTARILVTHVGSLPRSQAVTEVLFARERGQALDEPVADATIAEAVQDAVRRQDRIRSAMGQALTSAR